MRHGHIYGMTAVLFCVASCGGNPERYVNKGNTLADAGNYAEADINYQKAIQADASARPHAIVFEPTGGTAFPQVGHQFEDSLFLEPGDHFTGGRLDVRLEERPFVGG